MSPPESFTDFFADLPEHDGIKVSDMRDGTPPGVDTGGIFAKMGIGFETMLKKISAASEDPSWEEGDKLAMITKAIEQFVRHRTEKTPELPFLEKRLNKPPMDMPTCLMVPLPNGYKPHENDRQAQYAAVPFAPPLKYLQNPPENLYQADSDKDPNRHQLALRILGEYAYDQLTKVAWDNGNYTQAINAVEYSQTLEELGRERAVQILATWARDTAKDGVALIRAATHCQSLTKAFHANSLHPDADPRDIKKKGAGEYAIVLPSTDDLFSANKETQEKLDKLLGEVARKIDNGKHIENYEERSLEIFMLFRNVIDSCRWHLEHNSGDYETYETKAQIQDTLTQAYLGINTVLQTCNHPRDKKTRFTYFHDLADLIAGVKIDSPASGQDRPVTYTSGTADYLDAFMAVSQYNEIGYRYMVHVQGGRSYLLNTHHGGRSLLGNFKNGYSTIRQQLTTMTILYLRMPEWQAELYKDVIQKRFNTLETELHQTALVDTNTETDEPLLFVPTALHENEKDNETLYREAWIDAISRWSLSSENSARQNPFFEKPDGRMEVTSFYGANPVDQVDIIGMGSTGAWVDHLGFVCSEAETEPNIEEDQSPSTLEVVVEKAQTFLEKMAEAPALLADRLGTEFAANTAEMLSNDPETGSIKAVAGISAMIERLLGRKPTGEEADFVSLLKELGLIKKLSLKINGLSPDELEATLKEIRESQAELSDLDEGSIILLIMATSGAIPRELLVELVFKTYESASSALTLEAIMALEKIDVKRRSSLFGRKKQSRILKGKAKLDSFIETKRNEDPEYDPTLDHEWREKAKKLIKKITKILKDNKTYDVTMRSSLIAVLTAKEEGQLVARCSVDGELLTAILKFISPELVAYYTQTYGPEENLSLPDWYDLLAQADGSGTSSHGVSQVKWKKDNETEHTVADATSGNVFDLSIDEESYPFRPNLAMKYGEVSHQTSPHFYGGKKRAVGQCVTGGSHSIANLALEAEQLEYAERANPDDLNVLFQIINNPTFPTDRRVKALDKFLLIQPHRLAMADKVDLNLGQTAQSLETVIDLSRQTGRWGGAFFAANILRHAGFFTPEIRTQGDKLYNLLASQLATESQENFDQVIQGDQYLLIEKDIIVIEQARAKYLADFTVKALESQKSQAEIEREHRQAAMQEINKQIGAATEVVIHESYLLNKEEHLQEREATPTLGRTATRKRNAEMDVRKHELVNTTVAPETSHPALSEEVFEMVNEKTSQLALTAAVTGRDGKQLTGDALEQQLKLMQAVFFQAAFEITSKQLGSRASNFAGSSLKKQWQLEEDVLSMAEAFHTPFATNAADLGLLVPEFNPRANFAEVNLELLLSAVN